MKPQITILIAEIYATKPYDSLEPRFSVYKQECSASDVIEAILDFHQDFVIGVTIGSKMHRIGSFHYQNEEIEQNRIDAEKFRKLKEVLFSE